MLRYLLDTSFCIELLRDKTPGLRRRFAELSDDLCTSTVVLHELMYGVEKSTKPDENRKRVLEFASRLQVLDFDARAADHAGEIRANLTRRGCQIGAYDILIAAHARSLNLAVITGNLREFTRVEGLRCEDWS